MTLYSTTPIAQGPYSRVQVESFNEADFVQLAKGALSFYGRGIGLTRFTSDSLLVDIDIMRSRRLKSKLVLRGEADPTITSTFPQGQSERFSSNTRMYPLMREEGAVSYDQSLFRVAGETPNQAMDRRTRNMIQVRTENREATRSMVREMEYLGWQMLLTGKHEAIEGSSVQEYDSQRDSDLIQTITTKWGGGSQDIINDFDDGCNELRDKGFAGGKYAAILGGAAMKAFIKDSTNAGYANNRRYEILAVTPEKPVPSNMQWLIEAGFEAFGLVRTYRNREVWLFTYDQVWETDAGVLTEYMPLKDVLLFDPDARCDRYFGPPGHYPMTAQEEELIYRQMLGIDPNIAAEALRNQNLGGAIMPAMFHYDAYMDQARTSIALRTESAPIFVTVQTDQFYTMKDVVS